MRIEVRTDMMEREREKDRERESDVAVVCVLIPFSCVRRLYKGEREREEVERREREWGIGPIGPLRHGM